MKYIEIQGRISRTLILNINTHSERGRCYTCLIYHMTPVHSSFLSKSSFYGFVKVQSLSWKGGSFSLFFSCLFAYFFCFVLMTTRSTNDKIINFVNIAIRKKVFGRKQTKNNVFRYTYFVDLRQKIVENLLKGLTLERVRFSIALVFLRLSQLP